MIHDELKEQLINSYGTETLTFGVSFSNKIFWIGKDDFSWNISSSWDFITACPIDFLFTDDYENVYPYINEYTIVLVEQGIVLSPSPNNNNVLLWVLIMIMDNGIW